MEVNSDWGNLSKKNVQSVLLLYALFVEFYFEMLDVLLAKFHSTAISVVESKHQYFIGVFSRQAEKKVGSFF